MARSQTQMETIVHRIVLAGLLVVGAAAIVLGIARLVGGNSSEPPLVALVLLAASVVALAALSAQKQRIGRRIDSKALVSDGHLSAIGAMQAGVALAGTGLARALGWDWADPAAATFVGAVAVYVAVSTFLEDRRERNGRTPAVS